MPRRSLELNSAIDFAFAELKRVGGDLSSLSAPRRIVVIVVSAQGIIDNGGLGYFFESDFPGSPPYSLFVDAYRYIGAEDAAVALEAAVKLFPFSNPHKSNVKRNRYLDRFSNDDEDAVSKPFEQFSRRLSDCDVWALLERYVTANASAFIK